MPHVLVAGQLHPSGRDLLQAAEGLTVEFIEEITEASYLARIAEADALILRTQPFRAETAGRAPRLKLVSRHGVGYDSVAVEALNAHGIALAVCGDVNSTSVAEHALMLMLGAAKRVLRGDAAVRHGPWNWRISNESQDLRRANLLLVGYGRIGRHVAAMASGLAMSIRAYDPFLLNHGWPEGEVEPVETLEDGLGWADVISISIPKTDGALIGAEEFAAMRPGTILVNTARGGVVDEAALIAALDDGTIGAAGLDVFEQEPLPNDHPLTRYSQVILSPHIAGVTSGAAERMAVGAAQNVIDFFNGTIDPALVVNREHLHVKA